MTVTTLPNGVTTISNADYHADHGALSASGAKKLLPPSCPAKFKWEQDHPVYKDEFDLGSAAHKVVLDDAGELIEVLDFPDFRTNASKDARDEARKAGKIPLLRAKYDDVMLMADQIVAHPIASRLFSPGSGKAEQSLKWLDERTGILRRARLDWLPDPQPDRRMVIPDYKTAASSEPDKFIKSAVDFGYHLQDAWYEDAVIACGIEPDPTFVFVVQEREAPYIVTVVDLDEEALAIGRYLNNKALDVYAECTRNNHWPGYAEGIVRKSLPSWYTRNFEDVMI